MPGWKRFIVLVITAVSIAVLLLVGLLFFGQRRMIYFPQRYPEPHERLLTTSTVELAFQTNAGRQVAFYLAPATSGTTLPLRLWVFFPGNAMLALDWLDILEGSRRDGIGYLLLDYPGYGLCHGRPSRRAIGESCEAAFRALAEHLHVPVQQLERDLNLVGASLGTAAALEFAGSHPVRNVVLFAPFTSMVAMARRSVGWPLCYLLLDRYDNRLRLQELAGRSPQPSVVIFHGLADTLVPPSMSRDLVSAHPGMIRLRTVEKVDHNMILDASARDLRQIVGGP